MKKKLSNFIRFLLGFMLAAGAAMYFLWMPGAVEYTSQFFGSPDIINYFMYTISAVIALPLFGVTVVSFKFPTAIEKDSVFDKKTAKLLYVIGVTVIADCLIFLACTAMLVAVGERVLAPALAFVSAIGITVGLMLTVLSRYVKRAAELKEEVDCTL